MAQSNTNIYGGNTVLVLAIIAIAAVIGVYFYVNQAPVTTDANPISSTVTPSESPSKSQPQGHSGTITTDGPGAKPTNPQGGTPENMQAKPEGADTPK